MPNTASRSDFMTFDQNPESQTQPRSLLAPPGGASGGPKTIFWNEREVRAGWRLLMYLLLFVTFASAGIYLTVALHFPQVMRGNITAPAMLVQEGVGALAAMAAAAIMGALEGRGFGVYGLPGAEVFGEPFWQGVVWGIAMIAAMIFLIRVFGGFSFGEMALHGGAVWRYALLWALVFVCVGFFEEFLFRGYTQFTLASGLEFWPAAAMLSASFGALHLGNGGEDKVGAVSVFVMGMFFCLTLRRTGNLWFAVGLHASFDWGETFLFSVPNSGIVAPGHLLNSSFHGPAWLTVGTVGPEGSVMAFAVLAITAVIFSRVYPAKQ
jgi:membrane protease YdiL (CAAX protease family)